MSALDAFLSTWAKARATFGSGTPQRGASYDQSSTLSQLTEDLDQAAPARYWSGGAATAYETANTDHQRVLRELGTLDRRLAGQVDRSAQIVTAGRQNLDAIREWVIAAAASAPINWAGEQFGGPSETPALDRDELDETERTKNQIEAFRNVFGRAPVSDSDWLTASALDPHSYDPRNQGVDADVVVARIEPVPGQGVVRTNLFIPSEDVWAPTVGVPPYDNNLGDNRGFSPTAGPEASRVAIYTDFDNGIIVARQNPSINADTGQVRAGTPSVGAVQTSDGGVLIQYNAADPFSPGGEGLAKGTGISVNGTLGIVPSDTGPRVGGDDVTTFPALEVYSDRGGMTTTVLQEWPTFFDNAAGPLAGLPFDKDVGDPTAVPSFNSVVPQLVPSVIPGAGEPEVIPVAPPMSVVPPGNFTPFRAGR